MFLAVAQSLPATRTYFSGENTLVRSFGLYDYVNAIIGIDRRPIAYQFWFIRDLMVMVLLVPAIQLIHKTVPVIFLFLLFFLWLLESWPIYTPSSAAVFFFYLGSLLSFHKKSLFSFDDYGAKILILYLFALVIDTLTKGYAYNGYIHRVGILLGMSSAFYATKFVLANQPLKTFLLWSGSCSFFVFAIHEPMLTVVKKIAYRLLEPSSDSIVIFLYFVIPLLVIAISVLTYASLKSLAPRFVGIISGGR